MLSSSSYYRLLSSLFCIAFLVLAGCCEAKIKLPNGLVVKAIIAFGDSIVDQGMNNNLSTMIKTNFPPYGQDFMGGQHTGRYSNGKTPPDLVAEELGIKELVPAYLDPHLQPEDIKTGVSFASGASGYDPQTAALMSVIPLSEQLKYFKEYLGRLNGLVGEKEAKYIINNTLFMVVSGSDDLANTYFTIGIRRYQYDINAYTDLVVEGASNFLQELYSLGARRIGFFGIPPIGCLPSQRTLAGGSERECVESYNQAAQLANAKFSAEIKILSKKLPNSKLIFVDIYEDFLDMIKNPAKYGFEVVNLGCCGTGTVEVTMLCNKLSGTCPDRNKYLFWDSYHPTEKGYRIIVNQIITKYINSFT
ncbi:GDSL esterase/lipase EXL3-like [Ipomoea triloba]|uniref:GDSL esterase/lipase EXL3-like n=1 Tax=Ipomoea triloba TaxID=35885 RepID=UPI00125DB206|nr:GDSL esterase/lipase EXL3-like [Ipomoea triloba]